MALHPSACATSACSPASSSTDTDQNKMSRIIFRDFDDFAAAINGVAGQFVPTARPEQDWWVQATPIERVSLQQVQIGGAATFAGDGSAGLLTLGIPLTQTAKIRIDGNELQRNSFLLVKEGQPFTFTSNHATLWAGIGVPPEHRCSRLTWSTLSTSAYSAVTVPRRRRPRHPT